MKPGNDFQNDFVKHIIMAKIKIKGKVVYQDLGPGFWGIIGSDGENWRPINMPEQLKKENADVEVTAASVEEGASIFMWGKPVKITKFRTLMP